MYGYKGWLVVGAFFGIGAYATGGFSGLWNHTDRWWHLPPAGKEVEIVRDVHSYAIEGNTGQELVNFMSTHGPGDDEPRDWAQTSWNIDWKFAYDETPALCQLRKSSIGVRIRISQSLPVWKNYAAAAPNLQEQWDNFNTAMLAHEEAEAEAGIAAARDVLVALNAMPGVATCAELDARLRDFDQGAFGIQSGQRRDVMSGAETSCGMPDFPPCLADKAAPRSASTSGGRHVWQNRKTDL